LIHNNGDKTGITRRKYGDLTATQLKLHGDFFISIGGGEKLINPFG